MLERSACYIRLPLYIAYYKMKVQLISISQRDYNFGGDNLGIARLTAYLKQVGISVEQTYLYMDNDFNSEMEKIDFNCLYFGFSAYSDTVDYACKVVDEIKHMNMKAVCFAGSKFITYCYKELYKNNINFDFMILGDGEYTLEMVLKHLDKGATVNDLAMQSKHIVTSELLDGKTAANYDINLLPMPNRESFASNKKLITANICDSHGCIGHCTFCGLRHEQIKVSYRSALSLWEEVLTIYNKFGIRLFLFTGGSFELVGQAGKQRISEFCDYVLASGLRLSFRCFLQSCSFESTYEDERLLRKMKSAGFNVALIGVEAGFSGDLVVYNKPSSVKQNSIILDLMRKTGIYAEDYGFIMFQPYSSIEGLRENYRFLRKNKCAYLKKYIDRLFIISGTDIYKRALRNNLITSDYGYNNQYGYHFSDSKVAILYGLILESFMASDIINECFGFTLLNYVFRLIDPILNLNKERQQINEITNELYENFESFFDYLYNSDNHCDYMSRFNDLVSRIRPIYKQCFALRRKTLVHYYKMMK